MKLVLATALAVIVATWATPSATQNTPVWFPMTTTNGCIFYRDAYPALIEELKSKIKKTVWTGPPCKPGEPINGVGTLEQTLSDGGRTWTTKSTGPYVDGVRHGRFEFSTSTNPQPQTRVFDRGCDGTPTCVKRPLTALAAAPPAVVRPAPPPIARAPASGGGGLSPAQIAVCSAEIKRLQVESQSWGGGVAAVSLRLGRIQKGLFTGACAGHPEARAYLAGAERMIADGSAATAGTTPSSAPSSRPAASAQAPGGRKSHLHPSGQPCISARAASPRPHGRNGTLYGIDFTNICDQTFVVSGLRIPLGPQTRGLTQETGIARGSLGAPGKTTVTCIDDGKGGSDGCSGFSEWRSR